MSIFVSHAFLSTSSSPHPPFVDQIQSGESLRPLWSSLVTYFPQVVNFLPLAWPKMSPPRLEIWELGYLRTKLLTITKKYHIKCFPLKLTNYNENLDHNVNKIKCGLKLLHGWFLLDSSSPASLAESAIRPKRKSRGSIPDWWQTPKNDEVHEKMNT